MTALVARLGSVRRTLRAFRRTRPFWGGLWLALAGVELWSLGRSPIGIIVGGSWSASAAWLLGGGMVVFGLVAWFAPHYRTLVGLVGVVLALAAFVSVNLGGWLVGSVLGIVGGSMVWGWGEKRARPRRSAIR